MKTVAVAAHIFHPNWLAPCDDRQWLPHIFTGKFVSATFWFNQKDKLARHRLITTTLIF